jgi:hypothetical protein
MSIQKLKNMLLVESSSAFHMRIGCRDARRAVDRRTLHVSKLFASPPASTPQDYYGWLSATSAHRAE